MFTGLKLRTALLFPAILLFAACSLDPQPEPPMMEDGTGGMFGDAATSNGGSGGSAGSSIGKGGSAGAAAGAAGTAGSSGIPDASADAPCTGDNCFCEGVDGGCEAACDADCEGGCNDADAPNDAPNDGLDDASDAGEPTDGAKDDDALGAETGP